jgi:hypothetical protein
MDIRAGIWKNIFVTKPDTCRIKTVASKQQMSLQGMATWQTTQDETEWPSGCWDQLG